MTKVEQVARAIEEELFRQGVIVNFASLLALAAIKAMREPTNEMVIAGCRHENFGDMAGRWSAMIDAALAEAAEI